MVIELKRLISDPAETLNIECKDWIDIDRPEGKAKVVKGCLALWNSNGGYLVIGIANGQKDGKLKPNFQPPYDVRKMFDSDKVSQLISAHVFKKFEVIVNFEELNGIEFPILTVESGVRIPNVSKKVIQSSDISPKDLVKADIVYVRTLEANGSVSSAEANREDWEQVVERCFQNREADIGSFLRRHLTPDNIAAIGKYIKVGLTNEITSSTHVITPPSGEILTTGQTTGALVSKYPPHKTQDNDAIDPRTIAGPLSMLWLEAGHQRFETYIKEQGIQLPEHGAFEVCFAIPDGVSDFSTDRSFLSLLSAHNPDYWHWPLWMETSRLNTEQFRPRVVGKTWEASILTTDPKKWVTTAIDFWQANPLGRFYHYRGYFDDVINFPGRPQSMTALDPYIQMMHVAEAFVVGQAFAKAMGCDETKVNLDYSFRWSRLANRILISWLNPNRLILQQLKASDDSVVSSTFLPLNAAPSSIFQYVYEVTKPLFNRFEGHGFSMEAVENAVNNFLDRKS